MSIVQVKPLPIKKWHGKEGPDSFTQPKTVQVLYDPKTGAYATGLTPEQAEEFGKRMRVDLSDVYDNDVPHPYYSTKAASIKLTDEVTFFDTAIDAQHIKVLNMRASKRVANSIKEWEEGLWPNATHYIYDEQEEVDVAATKIQNRRRIAARLEKISTDAKVALIMILAGKLIPLNSINKIDVELEKIIEAKPDELIRYMKMEESLMFNRAKVLEALEKHALTREGGAILYMGELYAENLELAVERFSDPNNQIMKAAILDKIRR